MDKHIENRISIKINGKVPSFVDNESGKKGNFQKPSESDRETAATKELNDKDEFQWVLPTEDGKSEKSNVNVVSMETIRTVKTQKSKKMDSSSLKSKSSKGYFLKSVIFAIIFAIMIGIGLGMFILKMISKDIVKQDQVSEPSVSTPVQDLSKTSSSNPNESGVTYQFNPRTIYVVQAGVYSTLDNAKTYAENITNLGFPTAFMKDDKVFLFIGIGLDETEVKTISDFYKGFGIDTYTKAYQIKEKTITLKSKEESDSIAAASDLFEQLISATSSELNGKSLSNEKWDVLTSKYKTMKFSLSKENDNLEKYCASIDHAYQAYANYRETKNKAQLFSSQQALLHALEGYEVL